MRPRLMPPTCSAVASPLLDKSENVCTVPNKIAIGMVNSSRRGNSDNRTRTRPSKSSVLSTSLRTAPIMETIINNETNHTKPRVVASIMWRNKYASAILSGKSESKPRRRDGRPEAARRVEAELVGSPFVGSPSLGSPSEVEAVFIEADLL